MEDQKGNIFVVILAFVVVVVILGAGVYALITQKGDEAMQAKELKLPNSKTTLPKESQSSNEAKSPIASPITNNQTQKSMDQVAKNGDTLVMNYTGKLTNGTVFDSNVDPKFNHVQPFEFKLGAGQVIKGWDEGLVGMKIGEKKTLNIPPEKGYGANGAGSAIPPNATLIFDVELVGIK